MPDPQLHDQDDLVLSFLNSDYLADSDLSTNPTAAQLQDSKYFSFDDKTWDFGLDVALQAANQDPPSPSWSETASSDSGLIGSPLLESCDEASKDDTAMEGIETSDGSPTLTTMDTDYWQFVNPDLVASGSSDASLPTAIDFSTAFDPLTNFAALAPLPPALQFLNNGQLASFGQAVTLPYPVLPLTPSSPPSSDNASSSDSEQPKKKRGRKKRDPAPATTSTAPVPLKPLMPILPQTAASSATSTVLPSTADGAKYIKLEQLPPSPPLAPLVPSAVAELQASSKSDASSKKRPSIAPAQTTRSTTTNSTAAITQIKSESTQSMSTLQQKTPILPAPSLVCSPKLPNAATTKSQSPKEAAAAAHATAIAKRQERLIKNRAAALLSRKRKREHITLLEQHTEALASENLGLKDQVEALEGEVDRLSSENRRLVEENKKVIRENEELKKRVVKTESGGTRVADVEAHGHHERTVAVGTKNSRATGVVFMIILFSFALFTLPTGNLNRLTVGGANRPLIAPSSSLLDRSMSPMREALLDAAPRPSGTTSDKDDIFPKRELLEGTPTTQSSTELVLLSEVQTKELEIWLSKGLERAAASSKLAVEETGLVQSQPMYGQNHAPTNPHAYLYCANLAQVLPNDTVRPGGSDNIHALPNMPSGRPRLSLFSPVGTQNSAGYPGSNKNRSDSSSDEGGALTQYLQIDLEVLGSRLVSAKLVGLGSGAGARFPSFFGSEEAVLKSSFISHPASPIVAGPELRPWKDELVKVKEERVDEDLWPLGGANETAAGDPQMSDEMARKVDR
ncbi:hypothetical protein BC937DRAFT_87745 [Endogone sp. FLAS-F59071]|nr:hypothetical protein BC937DRAFT_87745 [Endogone sp. FLAS-F59071]|eukprot:RUS19269.1 hypothetical protein BC937DRAFT_87745 [Endogone sp. FLAS-F59071]